MPQIEVAPERIPRLPVLGWRTFASSHGAPASALLDAPHIRYTTSGRAAIALALRVLGVAGKNRFDMLRDVPTVAETVPGYEARTWAGVGAPKGTPTEIIARLNHEINSGLANPTIKARLAEVGTIPMIFTATEFGAYVAAESEKWTEVVEFAGIKAE